MLRVPCTASCHGALSRCRRERGFGGLSGRRFGKRAANGRGELAMGASVREQRRPRMVMVCTAQTAQSTKSANGLAPRLARTRRRPKRPYDPGHPTSSSVDPRPTPRPSLAALAPTPRPTVSLSHGPPVTEPNPAAPFSITRIPRGVAGVMQPEHPSILAPSRLNDRQRSGQGCSWHSWRPKRSGSCQVKGRLLVLALVLRCWAFVRHVSPQGVPRHDLIWRLATRQRC
jgi:hypothetical protein